MQPEDVERLIARLNEMNARQIVRWLTTPAQSGFYLSAEDMARLGGRVGVRISPFSRSMALEQLLRGAALDGNLGRALAELREEMSRQLDRYEQLGLPEIEGWVVRGRLTLAAWSTIEEGFAGEPSEGPSP